MNPQPHLLPTEYLSAIGGLVVAAAHIENQLTRLVGIYLDAHPIATLVAVHRLQAQNKIDMLRTLYGPSMKDDRLGQRYNKFLGAVGSFIQFRNEIVHAEWVVAPDRTVWTVSYKTRRGKPFDRIKKRIDAEEISQRVAEASVLSSDLEGYIEMCSLREPE